MAPNTILMMVTVTTVREQAVVLYFSLMDLPRELTNLIYHHAPASGYTAILCTLHLAVFRAKLSNFLTKQPAYASTIK